MCNAHFQHFFEGADTTDSSSSYSPLEIAQQPIRTHSTEMPQHEPSPISASSLSTGNWSYAMDIESQSQTEAQMYSPVSTSSYSGFHSPIEPSATSRVYALAGALQQQHHQPPTSFPESSQRSTGSGAYFNEAQQAAQRWPYVASATDFAQEMTMTRPSVVHDGRTQAQAPSTSPSLNLTSTSVSVPVSASGDSPTRDQHARIPSLQGAPLPVSIAPHLPNV